MSTPQNKPTENSFIEEFQYETFALNLNLLNQSHLTPF